MVRVRSRATAVTALALVAVATVGTAALAQSPSAGESPAASAATSMAPIVPISGSVVVIPKQVNNPYFDVAFKGAQAAAAVYGGDVTQVGPSAATDPPIPFVQTAITQGAKAIVISADDATAIAPALQQAMAAGIKVVGYDSSPAVGAYNVFVNQADTNGIGAGLAQMACDLAPSCTGEIAVLSAAQTATNQNAWIAAMQETLKDPKYAGIVFDGVVYGNDHPTVSTQQAQALLTAHPNLKVIVAPTTVGIVAAAEVVTQQNLIGSVAVTGLGTPVGMQSYVKSGAAPEFALWNVTDLGYLAYATAADLVNGTITGAPGETYTVPTINNDQPYTIGTDSVVVLGPPFVFNADNIDQYVTEFGF